MDSFPMPPVKVLPCLVCGEDVKVNATYPIKQVTCQSCYVTSQQKIDKNF
jgi:hypothetical protein